MNLLLTCVLTILTVCIITGFVLLMQKVFTPSASMTWRIKEKGGAFYPQFRRCFIWFNDTEFIGIAGREADVHRYSEADARLYIKHKKEHLANIGHTRIIKV